MRFPMGRYSRLRRNVGFIGAAFLLGVSAQSAHAQIKTTSSGPDSTSVTVYRDPSRGEGNINLDWLNGFALITEHRRIKSEERRVGKECVGTCRSRRSPSH